MKNFSYLSCSLTAIAFLLMNGGVHAETVFCESSDKKSEFEIKQPDYPADSAGWRIAHFTRPPYRQRSVYTVYQTSRNDRVLYVSEGNRAAARLDLGKYNPSGEYPSAKLTTYIAGGGFLVTSMSCELSGSIDFVNYCSDGKKAILSEKLILSAREGDIENVENLIDCGADPNFTGRKGCSPILATLDPICGGSPDSSRSFPINYVSEVANLLIDRGAYIDSVQKKTGEATIHKAVRYSMENGDVELLNLLIGLEADINAQDGTGKSPLMLATINENLEVIQALVEGGANIDLKDKKGRTALQYAKLGGFKQAYNFLSAPTQLVTIQGTDEGTCTPATISVKKGQLTRIVLKAIAGKMFKLTSPKLAIDLMAERGSEAYKNFVTDKKGQFPFTCGFHGGSAPTYGVINVE